MPNPRGRQALIGLSLLWLALLSVLYALRPPNLDPITIWPMWA